MTDEAMPGGFDLGAMLQQAQQVQADLMRAQQVLAETTVDGETGGVTVRVTGTGDLSAVEISTDAIPNTDPDSLEDLGDLIVAAYRNAKAEADELAAATLGPLSGGLDLGGLDMGGLDV
jgi:DNA-binding protein YbaB